MTEENELFYQMGQKALRLQLLRVILREIDSREAPKARLILEREEAIQCLRTICSEYGDNEWEDSEYLPDIIDKHLGDHLG